MCGRFTLTGADPRQLEARFGVAMPDPLDRLLGRFNAAPGQEVLIIHAVDDGDRVAEAARWGLVPAWAPDLKTGYRMINARSETVLESRAYGPLVRSSVRRCLIPADGFFEWTGPGEAGGPKRPVRFTVDEGQTFAMAGLCTEREWEGKRLVSCTVITVEANEAVAPIHDRMPAILPDRVQEAEWMDDTTSPQGARAILNPLDPARLSSRMANTALNRVGAVPEGPDLLEPL
jgi:putative SOS response-associated peptidase YedK